MKKVLTLALSLYVCTLSAQITRQWVATYNGQGDYNDRFTCVVRDAQGNYYLGGSTVNPTRDRDFLVVKLNATGDTLWTFEQDGTDHAGDEVAAIALTPAGNVVVTGISKGDNTSEDFLTLQLTPTGQLLWSSRYDFVGEYDQPNALAVDPAGNVVVTGLSDGDASSGENDDYLTIKYNSSGALQWAVRYNGLGNAIDRAVGVATNASGQVVVTGRSDNGLNDDFVTIAYDASGSQQWIKLDDRGGRDRATALTTDPAGNLLLTGQSNNGDNDDFWTLKYSTAGTLLWQKVYDFVDDDRAASIATDANGNVFVAGQSDQVFGTVRNWDYATVAYSPTGSQLWSKRFDGLESEDEFPLSVAADATAGRVFVTGRSDNDLTASVDNEIVTLSYQIADGTELWANSFAPLLNRDHVGNAVVTDGNGGCLVAGYAEDNTAFRDALALHYGNFGDLQFQQKWVGIGDNYDAVSQVATDPAGNIWAVGYTVSSTDNRNVQLTRFAPDGTYGCRYVENGSAASALDEGQFVVRGTDGNPVAAGFAKNSGQAYDIFLMKADALCDTTWTLNFNSPVNGSERAYDLSDDGNGNVLLTGRTDLLPGLPVNDVALTLKVRQSDGLVLWGKTFESSEADRGLLVRPGPGGVVWVAGRSFDGTDEDLFLLQYDANGNLLHQTLLNQPGPQTAVDLAVDSDGNAYLLSNTATTVGGTNHAQVTKFGPSANTLWTLEGSPTPADSDTGTGLALDGAGSFWVVGYRNNDGQPSDVFVARFDASQNLLWEQTLGNATADEHSSAMALAPNGQLYLAGQATANGNSAVFATVLSPAGTTLWSDTYDGTQTGGVDAVSDLLLLTDGFVVGGSTDQPGTQRDLLLIRYSGQIVDSEEPLTQVAVQVSPNPFAQQIRIDNAPAAQFQLFNTQGGLVAQHTLGRGTHDAINLPATLPTGVYYFLLKTQEGSLKSGRLVHF